ncbi:MAG: HIT family protein [Acholeplasmatales bacterium]|nr:MAG: HIT family protein [Acholeplasmatales bacterium]
MDFCIFCSQAHQKIYENKYVYAVYDTFPVSPGHVLIIPKAHRETYFEASFKEMVAINEAIQVLKDRLDSQFKPDGYNIGINNGKAAGQTVFHLHVHLIPRYEGDMDNPRGGVRGVIPHKQKY